MRTCDDELQFLAIKPAHRDRWQLPKGTIDGDETPEEAAVREVREEGGVNARIIANLGPIQFFYQMAGRRYSKTVDFFLMQYLNGNPADHDHEVKEARWFPLSDDRRLAFPTERSLLGKARTALQHITNHAHPGPPSPPDGNHEAPSGSEALRFSPSPLDGYPAGEAGLREGAGGEG